jgi:glucokinase
LCAAQVPEHFRKTLAQWGKRLLSGSGLENLYRAVAAVDETDVPLWNASEITLAALKGTCSTARAAFDLFCAMLGGFAGDVALTYGARGGIYIAGGIARAFSITWLRRNSGGASSRKVVFERTSKQFRRR